MKNKNYAKLIDGKIEYAPRKFIENRCIIIAKEINDSFYFARGYSRVIDEKPEYDSSTHYLVFDMWVQEEENIIKAIYKVVENETKTKQVRKFSKLKITLFCMQNGIWQDVKEYLEKIGYYDLFVMAQYFLESDEYFVKGLESFKKARADVEVTEEMLDDLI
jgi:hypothetical protein